MNSYVLFTEEYSVTTEILDDLSSRFIINLPEDQRKDIIRICFQMELAHWFYLDFYCTEENKDLKPCGIKEFAALMFQHIPFLRKHCANIDSVIDKWREYKSSVPTYGAILLNLDCSKVLLVQSYWTKSSWGFPKGKINEEEDPSHCAIREVLEETGFDISPLINKNDFIESIINEQTIRLYIITGIQEDFNFKPKTRNEIKSIQWFNISDLPCNKKDLICKSKIGVGPNAFFMVMPFIKRLKKWVWEKHQKKLQNVKRSRHKSMGDIDPKSHTSTPPIQGQYQNKDLTSSDQHISSRIIKPHYKRQLFLEDNNIQNRRNNNSPMQKEIFSKSWKNFKLNKEEILASMYK